MDFNGTWQNERGSEMVLDHHANQVVGTYRTNVGDPANSETFALVGFAAETRISFTVDFSRYGSLTAWVGYVEDGAIKTLWHLARRPEEASEAWSSVHAGASSFTRKAAE
ncbi:MAG: hypothetical protein ACJAZO_001743 [Myxococcota bacterium]